MSESLQPGPGPIQRSWQRCLHQGLSRRQSAELDLLPQGELSARQEQHRALIACFHDRGWSAGGAMIAALALR